MFAGFMFIKYYNRNAGGYVLWTSLIFVDCIWRKEKYVQVFMRVRIYSEKIL